MKPILPNCRESLSGEDLRFMVESLASRADAETGLRELLSETSARDLALESERVFQRLLESPELLKVSPRFYFYVLARRSLRDLQGDVADYLASVLTAYIDIQKLRTLPGHPELTVDYVTDMLVALAAATAEHQFLLQAHVGNYTLFMAGIFPDHIRQRADRHGAPGLAFYEAVGSACYRQAADHRLAQRHELVEVFRTIADHFREVRQDLNRLADGLLHVDTAGGFAG